MWSEGARSENATYRKNVPFAACTDRMGSRPSCRALARPFGGPASEKLPPWSAHAAAAEKPPHRWPRTSRAQPWEPAGLRPDIL